MKKFKITFAKIEPITGRNYYQHIGAFGVKQIDGHNLQLLAENLVVAHLFYASGIVSVEQIPNLDIAV